MTTTCVLAKVSCKVLSNIGTFYKHAKIKQVTTVNMMSCEYHILTYTGNRLKLYTQVDYYY